MFSINIENSIQNCDTSIDKFQRIVVFNIWWRLNNVLNQLIQHRRRMNESVQNEHIEHIFVYKWFLKKFIVCEFKVINERIKYWLFQKIKFSQSCD